MKKVYMVNVGERGWLFYFFDSYEAAEEFKNMYLTSGSQVTPVITEHPVFPSIKQLIKENT